MGCDIHLIAQHKSDGEWVRIYPPENWPGRDTFAEEQLADPGTLQSGMADYYRRKLREEWYDHRNYATFTILAGVRNYDDVQPISEPRGLPADLNVAGPEYLEGELISGYDFGDHSYSWLTLKELQEFDWSQGKARSGIVPLQVYLDRKRDNITESPGTYCRNQWPPPVDVSGMSDEKVQALAYKDSFTGTRITWYETYADMAHFFKNMVMPELAKIDPGHPENIRIVFGFDS